MVDLNKLKKDYENKVRLAMIENEFETKYGVNPTVCDGFIHVKCDNALASRLLNELPADKEYAVDHQPNSENVMMYRISSERSYHDSASHLDIKFYNNDMEYWLSIQIDGNVLLEPFFNDSSRKIVDSELTTYHPTDGNGLLNHNMMIPSKVFKTPKIVRYYGGSILLTDKDECERIISSLKSVKWYIIP